MKLTKIASFSGLILCSMILPCGLLDDFDFNEGTTTYESFTISSTQIGPYEVFCEDPEITFTVLYKDVGTYRPRFSCDFNNETTYVKFNPSFSTTTRFETYTYTYTPPTSSSLSDAGMKITFAIYDSQNVECLTSIDINVKTLISTSYKTSTNSKLSLNNNGFAYKVSNNKVTNLNEIIQCYDFKDYFDIDYYYRLPLDQFKFTHQTSASFSLGTASLTFVDFNNSFPYLTKGVLNRIEIPLTVEKEGNSISLKYQNKMFVNPKTLQMSSRTKLGYVLTNHFFLPVNCMENLNGTNFVINFYDFGAYKTTIQWSVKLLTNKGLIGDCDTSEFCVIGEPV